MKWIINLLIPQKYQDLLIKAQDIVNGSKTYFGLALMFTNQVIAPSLLALAGLADQFTALHGLAAVLTWGQGLTANPYVLKIGAAIAAAGAAHKADKMIAATTAPTVISVQDLADIALITPVIFPEAKPELPAAPAPQDPPAASPQ